MTDFAGSAAPSAWDGVHAASVSATKSESARERARLWLWARHGDVVERREEDVQSLAACVMGESEVEDGGPGGVRVAKSSVS